MNDEISSGKPNWRGRGVSANPINRFDRLHYDCSETEPDLDSEWPAPSPRTAFFRDAARTALTRNHSPDIGFNVSLNPYRGCEHGCAYCYARPTHEYFGLSAGLDFETKIFVKDAAPELLLNELGAPSWQSELIAISGVTDCYQPIERHLQVTRRCLEVLRDCGNPVFVITKNALVTRDIPILATLAGENAAVMISVTTLDDELCGVLEPRTSRPAKRLAAISALAAAGIPVGVNVAPVIPGLTDHELTDILAAAAKAGAQFAGYTPLRLPYVVAEIFSQWLADHRPQRRDKVLNRVRELRGGKLNDPDFTSRMQGQGLWAQQLRQLFESGRKRAGLPLKGPNLSVANFRRPLIPKVQDPRQLSLC